jgi:riboflavin kinase / FMN adenylyltransferase
MRVWNGLDSVPDDLPPVACSIGKFDGVHLGHQEILRRVVDEARRLAAPALLITFDPQPAVILAPDRVPPLIQSRRQKLESLERSGLTDVVIVDFDGQLAALDGEAFFTELVLRRMKLRALLVGSDFRFGQGRKGDVAQARRIGQREGFVVHQVPPVAVAGRTVSSSAIREAVAAGDAPLAWQMLGRPFAVSGEVVEGSGRATEMQFPTANLRVENELLPRRGVYVTETVALAARHPSVTNVGVRPTFGGDQLIVETHLLDFEGDLYGERVEVRFLARVRDEMRFASAFELADQIARDRAAALSYFQNLPLAT